MKEFFLRQSLIRIEARIQRKHEAKIRRNREQFFQNTVLHRREADKAVD